MNKRIIIIIISILLIIGIILVISTNQQPDSIKFKKEYESLNNKKNKKGEKYLTVKIPKDNKVEYLEFNEVMEFLENGTGILYFGFPECPWCRNTVPILIKAAQKTETNIYYYNALSIRDEKKLKDGKIVTTKKGTKEYYKLVNKLKDYLPEYEGLNDKNIKRLYFPTIFFIQGGKIVGSHEGTVESQKDPHKKLNQQQKKELEKIYINNINKIYGVCDDSC